VTDVGDQSVVVERAGRREPIQARTVLWAAGVRASALGGVLQKRAGATLDRAGRVIVEPDLTVSGHPDIFVIGDLASYVHQDATPLPGVAPVAMQQGRYVADAIMRRLRGETSGPFRYVDRGTMATIGRGKAVAQIGRWHLDGYPAWLAWLFIHILYLVEFDNRLAVLLQWAWNYVTWNRGARLITGESPYPLVARPVVLEPGDLVSEVPADRRALRE
jgi:NADH dehydrogenase